MPWLSAWVFGVSLFGALLAFIFHTGDIQTFLSDIRHASPFWLGAAVVVQAGTYVCAATVWLLVVRRAGSQISFVSLLRLAFVELFANQSVPTGGISGSIMVMRGLTRRGIDSSVALTALLLAALSYYAAYLLVGLLALGLLWQGGHLSGRMTSLFATFIVVVSALAIAVFSLSRTRGELVPVIALRWRPFARFATLLDQVEAGTFRNLPLLLAAVALQSAVFLFDAGTLWCASLAVGLDLGAHAVFTSFILASVVATLSPLPLGLGTFEGTCVGLLHLMGGSMETSLAATLILRGFVLWLPMLPGLWIIRKEALGSHPLRGPS